MDEEELKVRYELAFDKENQSIKHSISLEDSKYIKMDIGGTNVVISAIPLKDCLRIPGIKDGTLFQKNVRQSLGSNNRVNKSIKATILYDSKDFFFFHNGIYLQENAI